MKKNVWIFNHYACPPEYEQRIRNNAMAKYLMREGYHVTIFGASSIHNTDINLITDGSPYIEREYDGLKFVHIRAPQYHGNGIGRKVNMLLFPYRLWKYTKRLNEKPDVIINDLSVMAMSFPFQIAKRYGAPIVSEIRDLWPESIVAYGLLKRESLLAKFLYSVERKLYKKSNAVVFSMEGGYDYIERQGWEKDVPRSKVFYINNGVDLEVFQYNRDHYQIEDVDLQDPNIFKVVYAGSIRKVNNLGLLLDVAKNVHDSRIKFLIWGDGDEREQLEQRIQDENIKNVEFKGHVEKKYIPYIVSQADINMMHGTSNDLFHVGISPNKLFDYFAAGKPIIMDINAKYNPVEIYHCGYCANGVSDTAKKIMEVSKFSEEQLNELEDNCKIAANVFDYKNLTKQLVDIIERV